MIRGVATLLLRATINGCPAIAANSISVALPAACSAWRGAAAVMEVSDNPCSLEAIADVGSPRENNRPWSMESQPLTIHATTTSPATKPIR
jgi:hypothetical protein